MGNSKEGRSVAKESIPQQYEEIAEGMEAQFVDFLFTEMNKSVVRETPENTSENYYKSLLNYERAQMASKQNEGLGIKKAILDQIYPSHLRKPILAKNGINNIKGEQQDGSTLQEIKHE